MVLLHSGVCATLLLLIVLTRNVFAARRPNVIYLLGDDMCYGDFGFMGLTPEVQTPVLDQLHSTQTGVVTFKRAYSGGPNCSPTRVTVLTGRNHNRACLFEVNKGANINKSTEYEIPKTEFTIGHAAKEQGYDTAFYGKWHIGDFDNKDDPSLEYDPGHAGFNHWWGTVKSTGTATVNCKWKDEWNEHCIVGHYGHNGVFDIQNYFTTTIVNVSQHESDSWCCANEPGRINGHTAFPAPQLGDDSEFLVDFFEQYLTQWNASAFNDETTGERPPFFVYLAFHSSHSPHMAPETMIDFYESLGLGLNRSNVDDYRNMDYWGSITGLDVAVGRVRSLLREYNISNDTLLWFTNDNGCETATGTISRNNANLRGNKGEIYEGGIRVPSLVEWPSVIKGHQYSNTLTVTSDLLPTLLDIWDVLPIERDIDGRIVVTRNNYSRPIDGESILPVLLREDNENAQHMVRATPMGFAFNLKKMCHEECTDVSGYSTKALMVGLHSADGLYKLLSHIHNGTITMDSAELYNMSLNLIPGSWEEYTQIDDMNIKQRMVDEANSFLLSVYRSIRKECSCSFCSCDPRPFPPVEELMEQHDWIVEKDTSAFFCENVDPCPSSLCAHDPDLVCMHTRVLAGDVSNGYTCACDPHFGFHNGENMCTCHDSKKACANTTAAPTYCVERCSDVGVCYYESGDDKAQCNCSSTSYSGVSCENFVGCQSSPCENNGSCTESAPGFTCECVDGYEGSLCETNIDDCASSPCQHNGICVDQVFAFNCECEGTGYKGRSCHKNIDDCETMECANHGVCTDDVTTVHAIVCNCTQGFNGSYCEIPVPYCENSCLNGGVCVLDVFNASMCACAGYYSGNECEIPPLCHESIPICQHGGKCTQNDVDSFTCDCLSDYTGVHCAEYLENNHSTSTNSSTSSVFLDAVTLNTASKKALSSTAGVIVASIIVPLFVVISGIVLYRHKSKIRMRVLHITDYRVKTDVNGTCSV